MKNMAVTASKLLLGTGLVLGLNAGATEGLEAKPIERRVEWRGDISQLQEERVLLKLRVDQLLKNIDAALESHERQTEHLIFMTEILAGLILLMGLSVWFAKKYGYGDKLRDFLLRILDPDMQSRIDTLRREISSLSDQLSAKSTEAAKVSQHAQVNSAYKDLQIQALQQRIEQLKREIAAMGVLNLEKFKGMVDASILADATETMDSMKRLVENFMTRLNVMNGDPKKDGEFFLVFSVKPDLLSLHADVKKNLSFLADRLCSEDNPDRIANAQILAPLVADMDSVENMLHQGLFRGALVEGYKLLGKVEMLMKSIVGEPGVDVSSGRTWADYMQQEAIPNDWLDENGLLKDFFAVLDLSPVEQWSAAFVVAVKKSFRNKSQSYHPDKVQANGADKDEVRAGVNAFHDVTMARDIFESSIETKKYIAAYKKFHELFPNA